MKPALLLIDLQNDFIDRAGLTPCKEDIIQESGILLNYFREAKHPVIHIQTLIKPDGSNRMPHWVDSDNWSCIEGSIGSQAPAELTPKNSEHIISKTFFSAFESNKLHLLLQSLDVDTVILTGLYTHACIRSTALDAYQEQYAVWIAKNAIGSTEPLHDALTRDYLSKRGIQFFETSKIISKRLNLNSAPDNNQLLMHFNPANKNELISNTTIAGIDDILNTATQAKKSLLSWGKITIHERKEILTNVIEVISNKKNEFIELMIKEIGKTVQDCNEEFNRALTHAQYTVTQFGSSSSINNIIDDSVHIQFRPVGVIGLITPWNNPLAIPLSKIMSALIFGNTVVWKPAHQATKVSQLIMIAIFEANIPDGVVSIIFGDASTAQIIATHPLVDAVTATGSISTGKQLATLCAIDMKPLQAELGGNNAAIVMDDCDLEKYINSMVMSSFSFSGQRCTAIRRFIVEERIKDKFTSLFIQTVSKLKIAYPATDDTQIGPVISSKHQQNILSDIDKAIQDGASLLHGGNVPDGFESGNWIEPTVLLVNNQDSRIVQEETFGPVAIIQFCSGFDEAIKKCNAVKQGLVAHLYSIEPLLKEQFSHEVEAGITRINPESFTFHPEAPFLGWKSSGVGPAEHGIGDREFFTRTQAQYFQLE